MATVNKCGKSSVISRQSSVLARSRRENRRLQRVSGSRLRTENWKLRATPNPSQALSPEPSAGGEMNGQTSRRDFLKYAGWVGLGALAPRPLAGWTRVTGLQTPRSVGADPWDSAGD